MGSNITASALAKFLGSEPDFAAQLEKFADASMQTKDRICGILADNTRAMDLDDLKLAQKVLHSRISYLKFGAL